MDEMWGPRRGPRRNKQWRPVSHGLHVPLADEAPMHQLAAWQLVLPDEGCFTHLTAAGLYGWWLPPLPPGLPVFACQPLGTCPRRAGLHVTRHPTPVAWTLLDGLRVATPAQTLLACARHLRGLDLVVLLDAALHLGSCTRTEVEEAAAAQRAGAPRLRQVLQLADARSESAWETMLRMLHVAARVPVEPQLEVFDTVGRFVARGDLWLRGTRTLHEYDGGDHLLRARQQKDLRRGRALSNIGWTRRGYTSEDLLYRPVEVLRDADLAIGRPHDPARVRPWEVLLGQSLFTSRGRARFLRRLETPGRRAKSAHERNAGA
jgi:very-short-patch-repair endonuclease